MTRRYALFGMVRLTGLEPVYMFDVSLIMRFYTTQIRRLVGVAVIVVDGELQTLRKAVGEVLGGVVENVCRVLMEGPRNINTAVGIVAGFLPAVAVCGDVGLAGVKL